MSSKISEICFFIVNYAKIKQKKRDNERYRDSTAIWNTKQNFI